MWRLIRYKLIKEFKGFDLSLKKVSKDTYVVSIPEKNISIKFTSNFKRKDLQMIDLVTNSLINQIKDKIFTKSKRKNNKIK